MINIDNVEVVGWEHAIMGMRNPLNSWDKSDSDFRKRIVCGDDKDLMNVSIGDNDLDLMTRLAKAGSDHRKYLRMITVYCDINAPMYWWKEFDTYKVGTVRNSCSTMHKIHDKEFTIDDFSHEHISDVSMNALSKLIDVLNSNRVGYLYSKDKEYWYNMIQLLPSSYNQKSTIMMNYEVLKNIYHSRKNHKLDEWRDFCEWVEGLPYSELITQ